MIEFVGVTKRYRGMEDPALQCVSLTIPAGTFCLLAGPSGAGKSTLLRLLFRAETPNEGRVLLQGENVARLPARRVPALRRGIGVVFQDFRLLADLSVFENIALALEVQGRPWSEVRTRVGSVLDQVGLTHKAHQSPSALSGGEQQRVAIARALVPAPALLLCDEPTGNLDEDNARGVAALLDAAHSAGTTVVVATHDPAVLGGARRRIIRLEGGRVVSDTPPHAAPFAAAVHGAAAAVALEQGTPVEIDAPAADETAPPAREPSAGWRRTLIVVK